MSLHNHPVPPVCDHTLVHCAHCDVVYCSKCEREWAAGGIDTALRGKPDPVLHPLVKLPIDSGPWVGKGPDLPAILASPRPTSNTLDCLRVKP